MLTVITGPMYAGKTSALISKAIAHVIAGRLVIGFKPSNDERYDKENIVSHAGYKFPAIRLDIKNPTEAFKYLSKWDVFVFDEVQFFDAYGFEQLITQFLYGEEKIIIVSGLSQDSDGKPFGAMPTLLYMADEIVHLKAVCSKCKKINLATRTYRKDKNNKKQVLVGGAELYEARCFSCWMEDERGV